MGYEPNGLGYVPGTETCLVMFFPHSLSIYAPIPVVGGDGVRDSSSFSDAVSLRCQVSPISSEAVFKEFGVETRRAFEIFTAPGDSVYVCMGAKVEWLTYEMFVIAEPMTFEGFTPSRADHCRFVCEVLR